MAEVDYAAVLEDLEAKKAGLEQAIAAVRGLLRQAGQEGSNGAPVSRLEGTSRETAGVQLPADVRPGMFHGMSMSQAARRFLEMTKTKQRVVDIVAAMQQGGIEGSASSFYSNVYTTLRRRKDFIRIGGKYWALAEWYPNRPAELPKKGKKKPRKDKGVALAAKKPKAGEQLALSANEKAEPK